MIEYHWKPLEGVNSSWVDMASPDLPPLLRLWTTQAEVLKASAAYARFMDQLRREIAIETGIIERLYTLDRGITTLLIERGIDEAVISHGKTDRPATEIIAIIRDQEAAVQSIFDFVKDNRPLSTSYIKELHALLTRHQPTTTAQLEHSGELIDVELLRGDWKKRPNNPKREDGTVHEYAPPEHVASEMDQLVSLYHRQEAEGIACEVQAAWLHHSFTAIHPFQDGNGRVARCLASLVFIKAGWFPLTIRDDDRRQYLDALEAADIGDLSRLVSFFAEREKQTLIHVLGLSDQVLNEQRQAAAVLASVRARLERDVRLSGQQVIQLANARAEGVQAQVFARLDRLREEIRDTLGGVADAKVFVGQARSGDDRALWHSIPINSVAKRFGYFANRRTYSSWADIGIAVGADRTEIVFSLHGLAHIDNGTRLCTAIAYHRQQGEGGTQVTDIEPLSETPFQFSYIDDETELHQRFARWLEEAIVSGLNYWQRSV